MENKINIAELLKDCPSGMELDCTLFEGLEFDSIVDNAFLPIRCRIKNSGGGYNVYNFTKYGCWVDMPFAKCIIFPKGKTTWEGFQRPFEDGDIVATNNGSWIGLTTGGKCGRFMPTYCVIKNYGKFEAYLDRKESWQFHRLATEEEKQKLFDAIKANGYKWNPETKTLEKLPKFKVGDRIRKEDNPTECWYVQGVDTNCNLDYFYHIVAKGKIANLHFKEQDDWELVPNKFDISNLKPFDKVLVRDHNAQEWVASLFSNYNEPKKYKYICVNGSGYAQCIPYEGNEHLLGTTNDCDEYYKTWE